MKPNNNNIRKALIALFAMGALINLSFPAFSEDLDPEYVDCSKYFKKELREVISEGRINLFRKILEQCQAEIPVNYRIGYTNQTMLEYALEFEQEKMAVLLLSYKANANNKSLQNALTKAIKNGDLSFARVLNKNGANLKEGILIDTVKKGDLNLVKSLLEFLVNVNARNKYGMTAFMYAARYGELDILELLSKVKGLDVNAKDNSGKTAFMYAALYGELDILELLSKVKGLDVNARNKYGMTAFMYVARYGELDIVELLSKVKGLDVNAKDNSRKTAFMYAALYGELDSVELLSKVKGLDVNAKDKYGRTAFMHAALYGELDILELLSKVKGLDVNARNKYGMTAFMYAARYGELDSVRFLSKVKGLDVNAKDDDGMTAFMYAKEGGHLDVVDFLKGLILKK